MADRTQRAGNGAIGGGKATDTEGGASFTIDELLAALTGIEVPQASDMQAAQVGDTFTMAELVAATGMSRQTLYTRMQPLLAAKRFEVTRKTIPAATLRGSLTVAGYRWLG